MSKERYRRLRTRYRKGFSITRYRDVITGMISFCVIPAR